MPRPVSAGPDNAGGGGGAGELPLRQVLSGLETLGSTQLRIEEQLRDLALNQHRIAEEIAALAGRPPAGHAGEAEAESQRSNGHASPRELPGQAATEGSLQQDAAIEKTRGQVKWHDGRSEESSLTTSVLKGEGEFPETGVVAPPLLLGQRTSVQDSEGHRHYSSTASGPLPTGWPATVQVRAEVVTVAGMGETAARELSVMRAIVRRTKQRLLSMRSEQPSSGLSDSLSSRTWRVIDPNSRPVIANDLTGFCFLLHDLFVTPVALAWDVEIRGVLLGLAIVASLYWSFDVAANFAIGFSRQGELVMEQPTIALHYLKHWFLFDVCLLLVDWTNVCLGIAAADTSLASDGHLAIRIVKLTRVLKLFRVGRLVRLLDKIQMMSLNLSDSRRLLVRVMEVLFCTFVSGHIITCIWFFIGKEFPADTGETWLGTAGGVNGSYVFREANGLGQYLAALHWTVAQMTLGSADVVPTNSLERIFNVMILVLGLLFGSTIVSTFSAQIVQFLMSRQEQAVKIDRLRQFLRQHGISQGLAVQVMTQAIQRVTEEEMVRSEDVVILPMLSKTLRHKLLFETRLPHVMTHQLFQVWATMDMQSVCDLCRDAISLAYHSPQDDIFFPGTESNEAYLLIRGRLHYNQSVCQSMVDGDTTTEVTPGAWLCESALWSHWIHVGRLVAVTQAQLLVIGATGLWHVLQKHSEIGTATAQYARNFHMRIVAGIPPHAPWPSDLHVAFTDAAEIQSPSVAIGLLSRAVMRGKLHLHGQRLEKMKQDLREGRCALQQCKDGTFERIVTLDAVRVERLDGRCFVQVGKWKRDKGIQVCCQYPGQKRQRGQLPQDALRGLFDGFLEPFQGSVSIVGTEHEVVRSVLEELDMATIYVKTVHLARLQGECSQLRLVPACAEGDVEVPELGPVLPRTVYMLPSGGKTVFCAWLSPEEFELLTGAQYVEPLERWLSALAVNCVQHSDI